MKNVTITMDIECTEKGYKHTLSALVDAIKSGEFQEDMSSEGVRVKSKVEVK